jgi:ribosomal-protein-alanine N-acetyltransferase
MTRDDIPAVAAIDRLCARPCWADETFAGELALEVAYYTVALVDGQIAGYFGSTVIPDEAHITTIGVHPDLRRKGVAEALLRDFLIHAIHAGCRRISLEVREGNAAALGLYRKLGFLPVGRRRAYYVDPDEDAIVLWIEDTSRESLRTVLAPG